MTVEELLAKQKIYYKHSGRDLLVSCFNPEHDDSNPSMRVDKATGVFHCFSCGFKGNLFAKYNVNVSRLHKVRENLRIKLEDKKIETVGLQIPQKAEFFLDDYRGIAGSTYAEFKAFSYDGDGLSNRIIFPIYDITGKISCFIGRTVNDFEKPKYKIYPAKAQLPFYPMTAKPHYGSIILVEGIFDMLNLWDKGIKNVMCVFGTQSCSEDKLRLLQMLGITTIHVFFDGDEAGQTSAKKVIELCDSMGFATENIVFNELDPGSLSAKQIERLQQQKWPTY
jgi:DNA primase